MIEAYFGLPGAGKTYAMVSRLCNTLSRPGNRQKKVYCNMELDVERLRSVTKWKGTLYQLSDWSQLVGAENGLIVLDELNLYMPSRVWAKVPGALLWKWAQVRKSGLEIWYTSQAPSRVDKVVRELTFLSFHMNSYKMLGFFTAKCYAGIMDKFYCWNFVMFKMNHAKVYDTKGFIDIPEIYQKANKVDKVPDMVTYEYVEKERKRRSLLSFKRKKKMKEKDEFKDVKNIILPGEEENLTEELEPVSHQVVLKKYRSKKFNDLFS